MGKGLTRDRETRVIPLPKSPKTAYRLKTRGPISTLGSATFGQIRVQSGFMPLPQVMFRVSFSFSADYADFVDSITRMDQES
jgi:hypothetical protein